MITQDYVFYKILTWLQLKAENILHFSSAVEVLFSFFYTSEKHYRLLYVHDHKDNITTVIHTQSVWL